MGTRRRTARYVATSLPPPPEHPRLFDSDRLVLESDEWYTPPWVFDGLGLRFDLDVASPADPLPWVPANVRFTSIDDGLAQPWTGQVWCNPPYSDAGPWCRRWASHPTGLLLIRADLSTKGAFAAFAAASTLHVPADRIQFVGANGHPRGPSRGNRRPRASFSTVVLGRGPAADAALCRLAASYGGATRQLVSPEPSGRGDQP